MYAHGDMAAIFVSFAHISKIVQDRGLVTIIQIKEVIYEVSFGTVFFDLE